LVCHGLRVKTRHISLLPLLRSSWLLFIYYFTLLIRRPRRDLVWNMYGQACFVLLLCCCFALLCCFAHCLPLAISFCLSVCLSSPLDCLPVFARRSRSLSQQIRLHKTRSLSSSFSSSYPASSPLERPFPEQTIQMYH